MVASRRGLFSGSHQCRRILRRLLGGLRLRQRRGGVAARGLLSAGATKFGPAMQPQRPQRPKRGRARTHGTATPCATSLTPALAPRGVRTSSSRVCQQRQQQHEIEIIEIGNHGRLCRDLLIERGRSPAPANGPGACCAITNGVMCCASEACTTWVLRTMRPCTVEMPMLLPILRTRLNSAVPSLRMTAGRVAKVSAAIGT
jgi:hypothetical protein